MILASTVAAPTWIVRYVADSRRLPIDPSSNWLSAAEQAEWAMFANEDRRQQWLRARWIAKRLIAGSTESANLRQIEILSRSSNGLGTAPLVLVSGEPSDYRISLSHAANAVLVGMTNNASSIGVDLAWDVPQDRTFSSAWFTEREQSWLAERPESSSLLWGLKEAIFKSHGDNQPWNPRSIEIDSYSNDEVCSTLFGRRLSPLSAWIRPSTRGTATAVWQASFHDSPAPSTQELSTCL